MAKNQFLHEPIVTANALAATGAVFYVGCSLLVGYSRPTYMFVASSWMHGINMRELPVANMMGGSLLSGFLTFTVVSWLAGYIFARFYNWFAMR